MASPDKDTHDSTTTMCRSQPGSSEARASTRSLDTAVNVQRAKGKGSRTWSMRSSPDGSICSSDSLAEPLDDEDRPESPSTQALSENFKDPPVHSLFDPLDMHRRSSRSMEKPLSLSGSDELHPRSSSSSSRDSGIAGSSVLSAWSISKEASLWLQCTGPDDVACDLCSGVKLKAWKSCLTCVRSFCEKHARDHYRYKEMDLHQLVEVTKDLDVFKENAQLKQMIREMKEQNRALREEINSLKQGSSALILPAYICRGKTPTAADVTLDPETAHRTLVLSHGGKRVRMGQKSKKVQAGPQRFDSWECVLAKDGFSSGRHYWQVELNKEFTIGVMKSSAQRKDRFTFAPFQGYWCIFHFWLSFSALENPVVRLPINSVPQVLGVCVDVDERWVTFYNAETKDQIYTFNDMKLAPGDRIYPIFRTVERSMDLQINAVS